MVLIIFQKIKLINLEKIITNHVNECQASNEILKISLPIKQTFQQQNNSYFWSKVTAGQ